jgi:hypothetical protein
MDTTDDDILMSMGASSSPPHGQSSKSADDLGDMTFCMSNYAKEILKMMYMMRQVSDELYKTILIALITQNSSLTAPHAYRLCS